MQALENDRIPLVLVDLFKFMCSYENVVLF